MRADGLSGGKREALGLVDAPLEQQQLGQPTLALAERHPVLERGEDADRLAVEAFRLGKVSFVPRCPGREVKRSPECPRGPRLGKVIAGRCERGLGVVELTAVEMELAGEAKRAAAGLGATALLGEQNRLFDQRLRPVELESGEVNARELVGSLALEILPPGLARQGDRLLHHPLLLGKVAARPGDGGARAEGAEATGEIFGLQDFERPVDHLLGGHTSASRSTTASARVTSARP